ncbi:WS/DGAT/MGAT family O-acyltransferase [Mycobacterium decipiens]|uniref:Diacylglycerol O-acyltransferase n=1 Tax=Mycobacterium decipiens TaxID=1430326 RepID=A0A1X2M0U7_9MYCO|nr:wax ester/triacylglycerol synthase family O-acyltransferase [Mycobacterium decipiens]OSC43243.1 wax ester/triacylglycerol synthase family O-acyltransferase [Mycobacterium decipiens]
MTRISPIDLSFLLLERANRPNHMAAFTIFQKPRGQKSSFGPRLFDAYRHSQAAKPFNQKLKWLGRDVAAWETVEPDMQYHIRHIALPAPGSMQQFHETVSFLNTSLLDRGHPLWECYIIDGIEHGRIAVLLKVHHALIDGEGGLRAMRNFLSDSPDDKTLAGPWMSFESTDRPRRTDTTLSRRAQLQGMVKGLGRLPGGVFGVGADAADLGAQALTLKARKASLPFTARNTLFNNTAKSAARAYANVELPLADVKALAKATDTSVNDVVMTVIDDALHHYLDEHQAPTDRPLVAFKPMSLREKSGGGGGNQVSAELIPMGTPEASPIERLKEINAATTSAKDKGRGMQTTSRQAYALLLLSSLTMSDTLPLLGKLPSANLVISNMKGPTEQLYLAGAPMVAFSGLPIVPPGAGLNVTFASINTALCIAIGAAPEAVHEPFRLAELMERAFAALQIETGATSLINRTTAKSRTR